MAEFKPIEQIIRIESNRKSDGWNVSLVKELVRCKDCMYWGEVDEIDGKRYGECNRERSAIKETCFTNQEWYCADAERKDSNV